MPGSFRSALTALKERSLEAAAKTFINRQIEGMGRLTRLDIDSSKRAIQAELDLRGEPAPIVVNVGAYDLTAAGGISYIILREVSSSKEWVTALLKRYLVGRNLQVPQVVWIALQP